ncbi:helix-hairpin-helix domain-containing protein [Caldifermentibacillus hisashii]|uniref:helix-hairpin-helix domain-containing protein n=1 Tax=Caldifermentibacillus hisashii TaxID=996558 RepID=UPI0031B6F1BF
MTKGQMFIQWVQEKKQWLIIGLVCVGATIFYLYNQNDEVDLIKRQEVISEDIVAENDSQKEQEHPNSNDSAASSKSQPMKVDIKGAVMNPGVYTVTGNERVIDIIEKAGGLLDDADIVKVNLSQKVMDEMVIYIPKIGEEVLAAENIPVNSGSQNSGGDGKVNINQADASALDSLPGIGPSKAEAIIEYRETNGPFQKVEDLMNISGIGEKTFEKLKDQITVQ